MLGDEGEGLDSNKVLKQNYSLVPDPTQNTDIRITDTVINMDNYPDAKVSRISHCFIEIDPRLPRATQFHFPHGTLKNKSM